MKTERKAKGTEHIPKPKIPESKPKPKKQTVRFCPTCGSTDVFWASGLPQLWSIWECRNCGYRGVLILEDGKLAEKLRKDYQETSVK